MDMTMTSIAGFNAPHIVTELPGPRTRALIELDLAHTSPSLIRPYPLAVSRAQGTVIEDPDGNRFLDFAAGIAVCATGHCHPRIVHAIQRQAERVIHVSTEFYYPPYAKLAAKLTSLAPGDKKWRIFFGNSGAEAVEGAVKLARYYTGRTRIVAFHGAFHGRTMGALSLTASKAVQRKGFAPLLAGVTHIPFGYPLAQIEREYFKRFVPPSDVAAIIVEPIQGEGGYNVPPPDWLPGLRELCDRHDILLIADEVQSGMGRTGRMWAVENWDVVPDIICVAKGIASGMPLSAFMAPEEIMSWESGAHGTTFGGNPIACVAALETIAMLEEGLMHNAVERGTWMLEQFVRDKQVRDPAADIRDAVLDHCFRHGLVTLSAGESAIRFSPPLTVSQAEVEEAVSIFADAVAEVEAGEAVPVGAG
jgi:4-aminobutyrate aminotransferase